MGMPDVSLTDFSYFGIAMIGETFALAVVTLAISSSVGLLFAHRFGYKVDPNQEFRAQGCAKIFNSFFHAFPSGVAVAKAAIQADLGDKTHVVSVVDGFIVFVVIMALGKYLHPMPKACVEAILMVGIIKLIFEDAAT